MKKMSTLLAGVLAVVAFGGVAQAETRLAVQDATGTVDKMVVTDQGRIGVGTNAPDSGIYVKGAIYPDNTIKVEGNATTQGAGFLGYMVRPGALPLANDRLGFFLFGSFSGVNPLHAVGVTATAEADWTSSSTPGFFKFETTPPGSLGRFERMRITGSGNVGINTTTPTQKLEVNGGIRLNTTATKPACDVNTRGTQWFTNGNSGVADAFEVCAKDASNNYAWRNLY